MLSVYARDLVSPNYELTTWHKSIAITLVLLVPLRIIWRLLSTTPELPDSITPQMKRVAKLGHLVLYVVALVLMPLSGWLWLSMADKAVIFLNLWHMPPLVPANPDMAIFAKWLHIGLAWFCGVVVAGHIVMAFKHKWIDRDGVFETMWRR